MTDQAEVILPARRTQTFSRRIRARFLNIERRLVTAYWRRQFAAFGEGSSIDGPLYVNRPENIAIGRHVRVWHHVRMESHPKTLESVPLRIGSRCVISPYVHLGAALSLVIGDNVGIGAGVLITDHNHDFRSVSVPYIDNPTLVAAPVELEESAFVGEGARILPGVTVGKYSIIGAGSVVTRSVPAYHMAVGSPARLVSRFDLDSNRWVKI